ncbi:hypothetical protein HAX54_024327 [Datura stramonium]|uniref:Uncharacterized protein n=1 Tax=Datura stramonium TaxID=4076 RepID=A0ABS8S5B3_DATST|nr:hypothetical protein [Datura stramonium]
MDRRRTGSPVYARQWSGGSSSTGSSSPAGSPAHPRARLPPTVTPPVAAQRLAQAMASSHRPDDDEDDDEIQLGRNFMDHTPSVRSSSTEDLRCLFVHQQQQQLELIVPPSRSSLRTPFHTANRTS